MELTCKIDGYHFSHGTLQAGETTLDREIPEEVKARMLADHPDWFEILGSEAVIPEAALEIDTPEDRLPRTRKK